MRELTYEDEAGVFLGPAVKPEQKDGPVGVIPDEVALRAMLWGLKRTSGLTQKQLAERMGVTSQQSVGMVLTGNTKNPSFLWFVRYVAACGGKVLVEYPS